MKILFRPITLDAQADIIRYTRVGAYRNCDFSFANMYSWQFLYRTEYAVVEDTLFVRFYIDGGRPAYMMPQGSLPLRESIAWLVDDAASLGHTLCLLGVSEESRSALNIVWPEAFRFVAERDYADYIYLRDDLASLAGKRLQPKRNHVNRFIKNNPDYCYRPLTAELVPVCLQFEKRWISEKRAGHDEDLAAEREAMTRALTHFDELGLSGGTLWVGDKMVAFTYGSPVNADTFDVHVEKADADVDGAYTMINREFARTIPESYRYVNREEDLGLSGLRQAKLSYHPWRLQEKMAAFFTGEKRIVEETSLSRGGEPAGSLVLRRAHEADRPAVVDLWQTCFHDDSSFVDLYFSTKYSPERTYVVTSDGRLCSALQHLPYTLSLWGGEEALSYWAGLSTCPADRGRGYMGALIRHTFSYLCRRGFALASLIPAEPSLYAYYARFGFETFFYRRCCVLTFDGDLSSPGDNTLIVPTDSGWLSSEWRRLTQKFPGCVQHDAADFEVIVADARLAGGEVYALRGADGRAEGVAVAVPSDGELHILDACAADESHLAALLSALCHRYAVTRLQLSLPAGEGERARLAECVKEVFSVEADEVVPRGMLRVVDAQLLFERYADAFPNAAVCVRLVDDLCPCNTGVYQIKEGRSCKQPLPQLSSECDFNYDYDLEPSSLVRWIGHTLSGDVRPYMSLMLSD